MLNMNVERPVLSPNFTIDDIHKLREYNYKVTKYCTNEELINYYKDKADKISKEYSLV